MLAFEIITIYKDGSLDSLIVEPDVYTTIKDAYKDALFLAKRYSFKYNALTELNAFEIGNYKKTVRTIF